MQALVLEVFRFCIVSVRVMFKLQFGHTVIACDISMRSSNAPPHASYVPPPDSSGSVSRVGPRSLVSEPRTRPSRPSVNSVRISDPNERYQPIESLGSGSMGRVVLCQDRVIHRAIAVKSLSQECIGQRELRARFLREARVQGQLEHPSIVPVYDIDAVGVPQFTMRYVRGRTLASVIEALDKGDPEVQTQFTRRRLLSAFGTICNAVHYANVRGVVHRDLKPENVMLGFYGEVYVIDWGVALIDASVPSGVHASLPPGCNTEAGMLVGTPGFAPPEQWTDAGNVDARADVYALGCILYEILSFKPLHNANTARGLMAQTFTDKTHHASEQSPSLRIPAELDRICATATASDREQRYRSVRELHDQIETYLDGDRDLELRKDAARCLAVEAEALACSALSVHGSEEERGQALERVGRSLGLDPENAEALQTLTKLISKARHTTPPALATVLLHEDMSRVREIALLRALTYLAWSMVLLGSFSAHRGYKQASVAVAAILLGCCVTSVWQSRRTSPSALTDYMLLAASTAAITAMGLVLPQVFLVHVALVANTFLFMLLGTRVRQNVVHSTGLLGILVSFFVLQHTTETLSTVCVSVIALVVAGFALRRTQSTSQNEITRLKLASWHLEQLVPEQARAVVSLASNSAAKPPRQA
jgi:eukaryotic-like serine/threonine-protein kinase